MTYKALKSFSGKVNMTKGQIKEIKDEAIAKDLLGVKYIEEVSPAKSKTPGKVSAEVPTEEPKPEKKATAKGKKTPKGG